jgi:hypothetical protein
MSSYLIVRLEKVNFQEEAFCLFVCLLRLLEVGKLQSALLDKDNIQEMPHEQEGNLVSIQFDYHRQMNVLYTFFYSFS